MAAPSPAAKTQETEDEYSDDGKALREKNAKSPTRAKKVVVGGGNKK